MTLTSKQAYIKGWNASKIGTDMDASEDRFLNKYGASEQDAWIAGWMDYATDRERFATLRAS